VLGNIVSQLHMHHVARFKTDPAWPGPVWGVKPAISYGEAEFQSMQIRLKRALGGEDFTEV